MPHLIAPLLKRACNGKQQSSSGGAGGEGSSTAHTTECDTLVGRLAGLLLDRNNPDVPDLHEVRFTRATFNERGGLLSQARSLRRMFVEIGGK